MTITIQFMGKNNKGAKSHKNCLGFSTNNIMRVFAKLHDTGVLENQLTINMHCILHVTVFS